MNVGDNEFVTSSAPPTEPQTAENTTAPFEPSSVVTVVTTGNVVQPAPKPKRKRPPRMTPKQRAAKIAAGINLPGPQPKYLAQGDQAILQTIAPATELRTQARNRMADELLKALVAKLVALENNAQYHSVWVHFFTHGGVFTGPKYIDELTAAVQYLNGITINEKGSVG
jgi:hypothetical protein